MIRLRIGCVALAISMAAMCASSRLSDAGVWAQSDAAPHMLKIVAFGSSSTQGVGASSPAAAYPAQLEGILRAAIPGETPVDVVNRGIGGEDIDDMMVRLDKDVIESWPNIVIWQAGSNDPMRNVPLDRFERKMRDGIAALRRVGITVVLMEPQWCPTLERVDSANRFRDAIRAIGAEMKVKVIRRAELMHDWIRTGRLTMATMLAPDGLHMRDDGYKALADYVATEILSMDAAKVVSPVMVKTAKL